MTTYDVTHRTVYVYDDDVSASYGQTHLLPRVFPGQRVIASRVTVTPDPEDRNAWTDLHGNRAESFAIHHPHTRLEVTSIATVEVSRSEVDPAFDVATVPWEEAVRRAAAGAVGSAGQPGELQLSEYVLPSPSAPVSDDLAAFAARAFPPARPVLEGLAALASQIHDEFEFVPGATTVTTRVDEVLVDRKGVCQDFAHVMIGALRSIGLPARYVSGYLETVPPPGQPRLEGADVSHAWVSAWVPDLGWTDVDPTNDQFVDDHYVTTAWGRDYRDVTPLKGVIFTDGKTDTLTVTVDVLRVDDRGAGGQQQSQSSG